MRRLFGFLPLALAILFCCSAASVAEEPDKDLDNVLKLFPGYHLLTLSERNSETRAFLKQHYPNRNPSVIHADFDGDGHPDYALLLKNDKSGAAKLVVLLCPTDDGCKTVYRLDLSGYAEVTYLKAASAGSRTSQTDAVDAGQPGPSAKLRATGIRVSYFEKGEVVLHWNRKLKRIEEIQTGD